MTIPAGFSEDESAPAYYEEAQEQFETAVVPVKIVYTENENLAPSYATYMTWQLPVIGQNVPVQVLQKRIKRYRARFLLNFPGAGSVYINSKFEPLSGANPQGFTVTVSGATQNFPLPEMAAMTPLYAIASIAGVFLSVQDEAYGTVQ